MSPISKHFPVMCEEVIDYLIKNKDGYYIDCTFGAGGHSKEILKNIGSKGRLLAFDVDEDSIRIGKRLESEDSRFRIEKLNFAELHNYVKRNNIPKVDGIIFDLGISQDQIKTKEKGFSYSIEDSFLDMRMDKSSKLTASDILNYYTRSDLNRIFKKYGEIRNTGKLINNISIYRKEKGISTSKDFLKIIEASADNNLNLRKFIRQCFQAVRIETNNELMVFDKALQSLHSIVAKGGVVAIITFHSLEEKVFKKWKTKFCDTIQIQDYSTNVLNQFSFLMDRCIIPSDLEISENWSSRSAKLWVMQKN